MRSRMTGNSYGVIPPSISCPEHLQTNLCARDHPVKGGFKQSNRKILNAIALCSTSRNSFLSNFSTGALNNNVTSKRTTHNYAAEVAGDYAWPFHLTSVAARETFEQVPTLNKSSDEPDSYQLTPGDLKRQQCRQLAKPCIARASIATSEGSIIHSATSGSLYLWPLLWQIL